MVELFANIATFITPVCALVAFIWVVSVKNPHDMEEKHNREMLQAQLQSFTEAMNRLEKKAFEAIQELKVAIKELTLQISAIDKSREKFELRLDNCEKQIGKNSEEIHRLEQSIWDNKNEKDN